MILAPRHTTFDPDPKAAAKQNGENARDIRQAFRLLDDQDASFAAQLASLSYKQTFGDGVSTVYSFRHGLNSLDVIAFVYEVATGTDVPIASCIRVDENNITLEFTVGVGLSANRLILVKP